MTLQVVGAGLLPDAPFPHVNTTDEFRHMAGLDESG
jgi:hypothetical protein